MGDGRVGCDNEVKTFHHRRRIEEGIWARVETRAGRFNLHALRQCRKLRLACTLLQTDQAHSRDLRQRKEFPNMERASGVHRGRGPLPADSDFETLSTNLLGPACCALRISKQIRYLRRNRLEIRFEGER